MAGSGFRRRHRGDYDRDPKRGRTHREHSLVSQAVPRGHPVLRRIGEAACRQGRHRDVRLASPTTRLAPHLENDTLVTPSTHVNDTTIARDEYWPSAPE